VDVTALAGQDVRVGFSLQTDEKAPQTRYWVDDITLVCGAEPVSVAVVPATLTLKAGATSDPLSATVTGNTDATVTWSLRETGQGQFDATSRRYTAPAQPGFYHLVATSRADPLASGEASIQVLPVIGVTPASASIDLFQIEDFTLQLSPGVQRVSVSLQEGDLAGRAYLNSTGTTVQYIASRIPGTYHLVVSAEGNPAIQAVVPITVMPDVRIYFLPPTLTLAVGDTVDLGSRLYGDRTDLAFTLQEGPAGGSLSVTTVGPDDARPIYTAPATAGVYHLVATPVRNPTRQATLTLTVQDGLVVDPPALVTAPGTRTTFTAHLPGRTGYFDGIAWTRPPAEYLDIYRNTVSYIAPSTPGTYQLTATTTNAPVRTATVTIVVKSPDQDGDGRTAKDFGDLAVMADAYGASAAPGQALATDLNGDGVVDDEDLAEAERVFEQFDAPPLFTPSGARRIPASPSVGR